MKLRIKLSAILFGFLLLVTSCKKDYIQYEKVENTNQNGVEFTVQLPGLINKVTTYSITDREENAVQTIDILAFKINNRGLATETETFAYKVAGTGISTPAESNQSNKSFRANLVKDNAGYYRFVVLANVRAQLDAITMATDESKTSLLARLAFEKTGQWNATAASNYDALPMWGESGQQRVDGSTTQIGRIALLRSLARIDVNLSGTALSNFVITSVSVINSRAKGLMAPLADRYNSTSGTVTSPSLFATDKFNTGPLTYPVASPGRSLQQQIYVFESPASTLSASQTNSTELVIAGRYNGSETETYYRIAFLDASGKALPLLRNYKYSININTVGGVGYPTLDIASRNLPANMAVTTVPWDDSGMNVIATDGQYILALSTDRFEVSGAIGNTMELILYTDYPFLWRVTSDSDWLGVLYKKSGDRYIITFITQVSSNIGAAGSRTASVTVSTGGGADKGRITKTVTVTQRNTD